MTSFRHYPSKRVVRFVAAVAFAAMAFMAVTLIRVEVSREALSAPAPTAALSFGGQDAWARSQDDGTVADVAEHAVQSVVNIASEKLLNRPSSPYQNDPFFRYFFRGRGGPDRAPQRHQKALGSGVIVSQGGRVLTNNHVVEGATQIRVTLFDGRELSAKLVGADPKSDVAVLQLEGDLKGLVPLPFGNSTSLRLGETVLAIGNPFGVGQTVTKGIVSAKGRADVGIVDYEDFIQTDAAINPGNSGGALVNTRGELVGINTAILSRSGGYQGIGFAIPSNMAKGIMGSLLKNGHVVRGWLGVAIQDVDRDLAEALNLNDSRGVLLAEVVDKSPADRAGLKQGDVVVRVSGTTVDSPGRLRSLIAAHGAGSKVKVELVRSGKSRSVAVTLGELPGDNNISSAQSPAQGNAYGLELSELTNAMRRRLQIPKRVRRGVVVTDVGRNTPAARAGFRQGDVIIEFNRKAISSVDDFQKARTKNKKRVLVLVYRGGSTIYLTLK